MATKSIYVHDEVADVTKRYVRNTGTLMHVFDMRERHIHFYGHAIEFSFEGCQREKTRCQPTT